MELVCCIELVLYMNLFTMDCGKKVKGIQHYGDGGSYDGEWKKDNRNGSGRMDYKDGSTYIGFWMNDKRSGFGGNNKYEGYWKNDLKHGEGEYFFHEKGVEHSGLWINDIFCCGLYEVKNPNAPAPMNTEIPRVIN
ncbi:hypothetical protein TNIN_285591 [Trichonephila inaurata madagascariensis]|uniref:MORN repeat-containing protein 3 n=1 Tax=Trichonephila inaurata madagascariensis TaxID=2747483 RepID=A0A8X7CC10_9ARAC|nr:hypothetical protein TNIN_285591 [Trichonephila inaurata madagascariensis]